ncbi:MAG: copper homeostasis protein CutC [Gemmatimonadota bacterium]|nr:copper homeostasis protein CutC [Gemmatimonadota bacterium]
MPPSILVEACIDSVASALAAERGGAGRLELCASLTDGGTTPSAGMISAVKARVTLPLFVIVRPRGGGFEHSEDELDVMRREISVARELGADGIVAGALRPDGRVQVEVTRSLVEMAAPLPVTFHRAFDQTPDRVAALEDLVRCGVQRVLTSGGAATALEGRHELASLVARSAGRIGVMAGGGIREETVQEIVRRSGVREIHVRGARVVRSSDGEGGGEGGATSPVRLRKALPADESAWEETDEERIRALVRLASG